MKDDFYTHNVVLSSIMLMRMLDYNNIIFIVYIVLYKYKI